MPGEDTITVEGVVVRVLGNGLVEAELANRHRVFGYATRQSRSWASELKAGDAVVLALSPFDMSKGRLLRPLTGAKTTWFLGQNKQEQ